MPYVEDLNLHDPLGPDITACHAAANLGLFFVVVQYMKQKLRARAGVSDCHSASSDATSCLYSKSKRYEEVQFMCPARSCPRACSAFLSVHCKALLSAWTGCVGTVYWQDDET